MMNTAPPFAPPPVPPQKKGLSGLAWAGIGCGSFILLAVIGAGAIGFWTYGKVKEYANNKEKLAAEIIVASHPDLQKVATNDEKGEITVRTKSGEEFTVGYKEISQGKFSFKDSSGNVTNLSGSGDFSQLPPWVPQVPNVSGAPGVFHSTKAGKGSGLYNAETTSTIDDTKKFFEDEAGKLGLTSSFTSNSSFGSSRTENMTFSNTTQELAITLTEESGKPVNVQVVYSEK